MHHTRHKEILKLIRRITELDVAKSCAESFPTNAAGKLRQDFMPGSQTSSSGTTDTSSDTHGDDGKHMRRSERKKAKKSGMLVPKRNDMEVFAREDIDFVSEAIHLTIHESKGAWQVRF